MSTVIWAVVVLGVMGAIFGAILAVAAKVFFVPVDERVTAVREALAGANCGACGFPGCDGYAAAVVAGDVAPNKCTPGGEATFNKITEILGICADGMGEKMIAHVACAGSSDNTKLLFEYEGPEDCSAAMRFGNKGPKMCQYSCIGLGNCVRACQFDAIHIIDGVAVVDREACVACTTCIAACPKNIISLVPYEQYVLQVCSSHDKGAVSRKNCEVGCIGCTKCVKDCPAEAISMDNGLAVIDHSKCVGCMVCVESCPRGILRPQDVLVRK